MILVDTSVWIELLNGKLPKPTSDQLLTFVTCGPILQEVLQGLREGKDSQAFAGMFEAIPRLADPVPCSLFLSAAEIYRQGRRRGHTIRSSIDCLIAAIAIRNRVPVWHRDRDFQSIATFTPLIEFEILG